MLCPYPQLFVLVVMLRSEGEAIFLLNHLRESAVKTGSKVMVSYYIPESVFGVVRYIFFWVFFFRFGGPEEEFAWVEGFWA